MIWLYLTGCTKSDEHEVARKLSEYAFRDIFKRSAMLCHDQNGRPRFKDEDKIHVSISHSNTLCAVAISDHEIGVDVEHTDGTEERLMRLAKRYFTPSEADYVITAPAMNFYEVWCAKESYMKYTGEGFSRPMSSFSVFDSELCFSHFLYEDYAVCICSSEKYTSKPIYVIL